MHKRAHKSEHLLRTNGKVVDFLLSLENRKFGSRQDTTADEVESELVVLVLILRYDYAAHEFLDKLDEPYQDEHVTYIESCMERCQNERKFSSLRSCIGSGKSYVVAHKRAHHVYERLEADEHPEYAEQVEEHVGEGGSARLSVGCERGDIWCYGCTDILAHNKRNSLIDWQNALRAQNHGYCHDGSRTLHAHSKDTAQQEKEQNTKESVVASWREEIKHRLIMSQIHVYGILPQHTKTEEEEAQAKNKFAETFAFLGIVKR